MFDRYSFTAWAKDAAERAVKTAAQVALGLLTADHVIGLMDVDFAELGSVTALAALVSLLTSLASTQVGNPDTAGLDRAPRLVDEHGAVEPEPRAD